MAHMQHLLALQLCSIILQQLQIFQQLLDLLSQYFSLRTNVGYVRKLIHRFKINIIKVGEIRKQLVKTPQIPRGVNHLQNKKLIKQLFDRTGLFPDHLSRIVRRIESNTNRAFQKKSIYDIDMRVTITLHFLRQHTHYSELASTYAISKATISRIRTTLPQIYACNNEQIRFPPSFSPIVELKNAVGAIDCTPHFRERVHPGSLLYYRGDYKDYFLSCQLVVGFDGQLWDVFIGLGQNNDMGIYQQSELSDYLRLKDITLLGDKGYISQLCITAPKELDKPLRQRQKQLRVVVERVFSSVKNWRFASDHVRINPSYQRIALLVIYNLVAEIMKEFPIVSSVMIHTTL